MKYGGMDASMVVRLKDLEQGNSRLKRMYADVQLKYEAVRDALEKNGKAIFACEDGQRIH